MTLHLAQPVPTPAPIQPTHGAIYRLVGGHHRLMNGTALCVVAHLVNAGTVPATVTGCISGVAGTLTIKSREAFFIGWSVSDTSWQVLRMCDVLVGVDPKNLPSGVHLQPGLAPADAGFLVETLDGITARIPFSIIEEYLAGRLPKLTVVQTFPVWESPK